MIFEINKDFLSTRTSRYVFEPNPRRFEPGIVIRDRFTGKYVKDEKNKRKNMIFGDSWRAFAYLEAKLPGSTMQDEAIVKRFILVKPTIGDVIIQPTVGDDCLIIKDYSCSGDKNVVVCVDKYGNPWPMSITMSTLTTFVLRELRIAAFKNSDEAYSWLKEKIK